MDDDGKFLLFISGVLGLLIVFGIGHLVGVAHGKELKQDEASERGLGLYCPVDGEFAWVGECTTKEGQ